MYESLDKSREQFANPTRALQAKRDVAFFGGGHQCSKAETDLMARLMFVGHAELSFKDQFVSRRDMWRISQFLHTNAVYTQKKMEYEGIRFRIEAIMAADGREIPCGLISSHTTRFSFTSRSNQTHILIEASSDMYHFDHSGNLQVEKAVMFVRSYFDRCIR